MSDMGYSGAIIRLTTDAPDDNISMALNLFFDKDGETMLRKCGPLPECEDIKLTDYIRLAAKTMKLEDLELPEDDRDLDCLVSDMLDAGPEEPEGILAVLHTASWVAAELRHRVKGYEDAGAPFIDDKDMATLKAAVQVFGSTAQVDMAIEEMSELTKALLKYRRYNGDRLKKDNMLAEAIAEEMADVFIMLYQLIYIFGNAAQVQKVVWGKIERLRMHLPFEDKKERKTS